MGSAQLSSTEDIDTIADLIHSQFAALNWGDGREADWSMFRSGFLDEASLFPAARPARPQSVQAFIDRMFRLSSDGTLVTFSEQPLGVDIRVFGNIAVALAGCEMLENEVYITRDVSAFLLVKDNFRWQIAAQAWDFESERAPIPPSLSGSR